MGGGPLRGLTLDEPLRRRLVAFARRFVRDAHEAEDVAQETLMRARDGMAELRTDERAEAWIFRICRHAAIDLVRTRNVRRGVWVGLPAEAEEQVPARTSAEPSDLSPGEGLLADLPAHQRVLLGFHALGGRGQPELCRRTGLSASALRVRLYRARRQLLGETSSVGGGPVDRSSAPLPGASAPAPEPRDRQPFAPPSDAPNACST